MNEPILMNISNSLVFSKLFYCSSVWAGTTQTSSTKICCEDNHWGKKFDVITKTEVASSCQTACAQGCCNYF